MVVEGSGERQVLVSSCLLRIQPVRELAILLAIAVVSQQPYVNMQYPAEKVNLFIEEIAVERG